jgi:hypothetical protein
METRERNMDRPTKGYKAVIRYNEFRWIILEMDIPADATIIESGNGFYRTDKVIPRHFYPTLTKTAIIDTSAHSWFDQNFEYKLNELAVSNLDKNPNRDCTEGIHFFKSREQAIHWGMANFGRLASL